MVEEGDRAPGFDLPAVAGRRLGLVTLEEFLDESAVVIVFYPADFNPSCTDETTDLDEFEVFRMQSDATVLAISGDSIYSHRNFAKAYDLTLPLLADVDGEVAEAYGVTADDARYPTRRAIFVVDHDGHVVYRWVGADIEDRPDVDAVQAAFRGIQDADLATTQYRQGCERYDQARDTFVEGMRAYERHEWVLARSEFDGAADDLGVAADAFETAARFSEAADVEASFQRGEEVASKLDRAIGLMRDSARAYASGERRRAEELRRDGEAALEQLRELGAPPDPEQVPVDLESVEPGETVDVSLDIDFEFDPERPAADGPDEPRPDATGDDTATPQGDAEGTTRAEAADGADGAGEASGPTADRAADDTTAPDDEHGEAAGIDEADLDALTAEIAAQETEDTAVEQPDETDGAESASAGGTTGQTDESEDGESESAGDTEKSAGESDGDDASDEHGEGA